MPNLFVFFLGGGGRQIIDKSNFMYCREIVEEDLPVQGPLPYEPDDAPWKRASESSGVRKLCVSIFFFFDHNFH